MRPRKPAKRSGKRLIMEKNSFLFDPGEVTIIIPSYEPDYKLIETVDGLEAEGFTDIVVIDDGSGEEYAEIFRRVCEKTSVTLLSHPRNRGKGAALKTGFRFFLENRPDKAGAVTVDGDGQHLPADVRACARRMMREESESPAAGDGPEGHAVVLGSRDFSDPSVPRRSRMGNRITRVVFSLLCGIRLSDTQTGLRAIPRACLSCLAGVRGSRFEYETNMLIDLKSRGTRLLEERIETVYIDSNRASHFRTFSDSVRLYSYLLFFGASSFTSWLIDLAVFYLLMRFAAPHFPAFAAAVDAVICNVVARCTGSFINYLINRSLVFRSWQTMRKTFFRFVCVVAFIMLSAGLCIKGLTLLFGIDRPLLATIIKVFVDFVFFFINFKLQRAWVFAEHRGKNR